MATAGTADGAEQHLADTPAAAATGTAAEASEARVPAKKAASGRSRRASVPSWDEIMFGTSRQPD